MMQIRKEIVYLSVGVVYVRSIFIAAIVSVCSYYSTCGWRADVCTGDRNTVSVCVCFGLRIQRHREEVAQVERMCLTLS